MATSGLHAAPVSASEHCSSTGRPHATDKRSRRSHVCSQKPATGAPPGTRTPSPRIKSRTCSCRRLPEGAGRCHLRRLSEPASSVVQCRPVLASSTATEHLSSTATTLRCSAGGLDGGVDAIEAADLGSAGSVVTVTWSVAPARSDRCMRAEEGSHSRSGSATTGASRRPMRSSHEATCRPCRPPSLIRCPRLCRLIAGAFPQGGGGLPCRQVPSCDGRPPPPSTRGGHEQRPPVIYSHSR
jgi:hypothetical protein